MANFRPKYVTFDTHGTLINFEMAGADATSTAIFWMSRAWSNSSTTSRAIASTR
ncbi:MAG: hypothetical protein P8X76_17010 [Maritimibacter sp.]